MQTKKTYAIEPEDEGTMLSRDVGSHSPEDATLHPSRLENFNIVAMRTSNTSYFSLYGWPTLNHIAITARKIVL
jgi:hypothetical protein